jgi:hypothetical protein
MINGYEAICAYEGQWDERDKYGRRKLMTTMLYVARLLYEATHPLATRDGKMPFANVGRSMLYEYDPDYDFTVDHIDKNKLNNSPDNLRLTTKRIQNLNKEFNPQYARGIQCFESLKRGLRYHVSVYPEPGQKRYLGVYSDFNEAWSVYHAGLIEIYGDDWDDETKLLSQEILDSKDAHPLRIYPFQSKRIKTAPNTKNAHL